MLAARKVEKISTGPRLRPATKKPSLPFTRREITQPKPDQSERVDDERAQVEARGCAGARVHGPGGLVPKVSHTRNPRQPFRQSHRPQNRFRHHVGSQRTDQRHVRWSLEHAGS